MALATHQVQGSYATFQSRPLPWNRGIEPKRFVTKLRMISRIDRPLSLKCKSCLRVGAHLVQRPKGKSLRISAFKGRGQNDESQGTANGSKSVKNSVKLSYVSRESEETLTDSPNGQNGPLSYTNEADLTIAGSNLFKNWLTFLRTPLPSQLVDEISDGLAPREVSERHTGTQKKERVEILKAVWYYFLGLDATVKIPLLIFIPWFLAVNAIYGAEVSKELTPLWVLGPLIVVLYIKMLRGLCALYVFSFKQTVKVIRNLPTYYIVAYSYIARGKLKEDVQAYFWKPMVNIKNLNYKEVSRRKMKDLRAWIVEKYLDFVESIWPYYCRTIRFLKRANLI